jgi:hypothetical protein
MRVARNPVDADDREDDVMFDARPLLGLEYVLGRGGEEILDGGGLGPWGVGQVHHRLGTVEGPVEPNAARHVDPLGAGSYDNLMASRQQDLRQVEGDQTGAADNDDSHLRFHLESGT